jgi:ABC-type dipeptide/oligopeptide/nickel transport system ATPase component
MSQLVGIYGASGCGKTRFVEAIVKHISIGGLVAEVFAARRFLKRCKNWHHSATYP